MTGGARQSEGEWDRNGCAGGAGVGVGQKGLTIGSRSCG